jgi:hypothetical protein
MTTGTTGTKIAAIVLAGVIAGCGGSKPTNEPLEAARDSQKHDTPAGKQPGGTAAMPPAITAFHDVLAPRWHAEKGAKRMADTCSAIPELRASADAIVAAPAPEGRDAAAWSTGGKQLADAVGALDAPCKASDAAAFETAFHDVHERFHGVMELAMGGHGEHDDHH